MAQHDHRVARLDPARIPGLAQVLQMLVISGDIQADEAEATFMAALEAASADEPGERTRRRIELMENVAAQGQIRAGIETMGDFTQGRLNRARETLLAVSDKEWQAAGGVLDD